ncbi:MAG: hypothetical protein V3V68_04970 [Nitrosomonadaceae bacterium]
MSKTETHDMATRRLMDLHTYETRRAMDVEDNKPCTCGDSHCESCN